MDLIIGAGISGLSYAATTKNDCLVVEKDSTIGGYCRTIREKDYVWDYSGHFFHFQRPEIKDFVMSRIPADEILKVEKHTQIYYKGIMVDYPFQMNIHQLEKQAGISYFSRLSPESGFMIAWLMRTAEDSGKSFSKGLK